MITKYGYYTVGIVCILIFILVIVAIYNNNNYIKIPIMVISGILLIFTIYFFRDPIRKIPKRENIVVSPADGKVLFVKKLENHKFIQGPAWQISVFMSPLNVHVNRIPISGTVEYLNYIEGDYLVAFHDKADDRNERNEVGIISPFGKVFFTQVAGFIARRIVSELKKGERVTIGNKFGMIKFGSR
jgi:phosphatidylserine decarboxylase